MLYTSVTLGLDFFFSELMSRVNTKFIFIKCIDYYKTENKILANLPAVISNKVPSQAHYKMA